MLKRILSLALCLSLLLASTTALAAKKKKVEEPAAPAILPAYVGVTGTITSIDAKQKTVELKLPEDAGSIVLHMGDGKRIVDNTKRAALAFDKLSAGMEVYAWHSSVVTRSSPPQSTCLAMLANVAEGSAAGQYFEVERIYKSGSTYTLLNQPQDCRLSMDKGIKFKTASRNSSAKISAIKPGAQFLYWADSTGEGEATTSSGVMFDYAYAGYFILEQGYINVNGYMLANQAITTEAVEATETEAAIEAATYIPMEEAAKRLGYSSKYVKNTETMTLRISTRVSAVLTAGQETFTYAKQTLQAPAPKLVDNVFYVPLDAIRQMGNFKIVMQ